MSADTLAALDAYRAHVAESHHEYERATALDYELSELLGAELERSLNQSSLAL